MLAGKVVGSVVATRKNEKLIGNKFMIVEVVDKMRAAKQNTFLWLREVLLVSGATCKMHLSMRQLSELLMMEQDWSSESLWK